MSYKTKYNIHVLNRDVALDWPVKRGSHNVLFTQELGDKKGLFFPACSHQENGHIGRVQGVRYDPY